MPFLSCLESYNKWHLRFVFCGKNQYTFSTIKWHHMNWWCGVCNTSSFNCTHDVRLQACLALFYLLSQHSEEDKQKCITLKSPVDKEASSDMVKVINTTHRLSYTQKSGEPPESCTAFLSAMPLQQLRLIHHCGNLLGRYCPVIRAVCLHVYMLILKAVYNWCENGERYV